MITIGEYKINIIMGEKSIEELNAILGGAEANAIIDWILKLPNAMQIPVYKGLIAEMEKDLFSRWK